MRRLWAMASSKSATAASSRPRSTYAERVLRALGLGLAALAVTVGGCVGEGSGSVAGGDASSVSGNPLTVEEALASDRDGPLLVTGTVYADHEIVRLCSGFRESHPPQCGEPSLRVRGLDLVGVSNMEQAKGATWSRREVTLTGEVDEGVLTVATR